jgi:hypothetical protein
MDDEGCSKLLVLRKLAKLLWLQHSWSTSANKVLVEKDEGKRSLGRFRYI